LADTFHINNNLVTVNNTGEGVSTYNLSATDAFGKKATASVQLTYFKNLKPFCVFTVTKTGELSDYEIEIDASTSYDQDSKFGGEIVSYEYIVGNDYDEITSLSSIRYICSGTGQKTITVRVKDNDGEWSDEAIMYFMLD
jgi:hypothetical protein